MLTLIFFHHFNIRKSTQKHIDYFVYTHKLRFKTVLLNTLKDNEVHNHNFYMQTKVANIAVFMCLYMAMPTI
jgi:hypothetical protein